MTEKVKFFGEWTIYPAGKLAYLVSKLDGRVVSIPSPFIGVLYSMQNFATLDEHISDLTVQSKNHLDIKSGFFKSILSKASEKNEITQINRLTRDALLFAQEHNLLSSENDVLNIIRKSLNDINSTPPPKISSVGIPTCGNPKKLQNCLESLSRHLTNRNVKILICDDNRDVSASEEVSRLGSRFSNTHGHEVFILNRLDRENIARDISRTIGDIDIKLIEYALVGPQNSWTSGASRNTLQLMAGASLSLQLDDDVILDMIKLHHPSADSRQGISIENIAIVHEARHFKDANTMNDLLLNESTNLLDLHETVLGRSLGDIDETTNYKHSDYSLWESIAQNNPKIGLSFPGAYGLPVFENRLYELISQKSHKEFDPKLDRFTAFAVNNVVISNDSWCMTMNFGIDNRNNQIPFPPEGRREDALFGHINKYLRKDYLVAHLPQMLNHQPDPSRQIITNHNFDPYSVADIMSVAINDLIGQFLKDAFISIDKYNMSTQSAIDYCSNHLIQLSLVEDNNLFEAIINSFRRRLFHTTDLFVRELNKPASSETTKQEILSRTIKILQERFGEIPDIVDSTRGRRKLDLSEMALVRSTIRKYALLLKAWPKITSAYSQ